MQNKSKTKIYKFLFTENWVFEMMLFFKWRSDYDLNIFSEA